MESIKKSQQHAEHTERIDAFYVLTGEMELHLDEQASQRAVQMLSVFTLLSPATLHGLFDFQRGPRRMLAIVTPDHGLYLMGSSQ